MRADRLLAILFHLQIHQNMTTYQLAELLEVSRRTILRDIEALSAAGVPLYTQSGTGGGIRLDERYRLSLTGLHTAEAQALFFSGNTTLLADIGLAESAKRLLLKFYATLPALHQQAVAHMQQRLLIDSTWWVDIHAPDSVPYLLDAVNQDRYLQMIYQHHDGHIVERTVEPYGLVAKAGTWYLIARRMEEFRIYRVSRIHQVTMQDHTFQRQADFDLQHFWQTHIHRFVESLLHYRYTLKIREERKDFVRWYSTGRYQIIETEHDEGWFTAHFEAEGIEPAMMFVFGLGKDVIVIKPPSLINAILDRSQDMCKHHVPD
ncbi:MAG: putative DNA-binding transcriptional regulator YafY, contains an HTH and WYL domains [Chloroflexi bacterium AL-W]|nr:putative DNA-binding transcriptional regulator YafY, contains an HTH and WYL domains [Chloroflexi bacterium AL-N1]NOK65642.1 putative DNA-binding transcriptional regulator YafY, contains an HTH and WYL domains [Chloroflexi bacterium AL-N10]NOK74417.1 putative DNA-binding transcriptional regulator YafY, contains an HTH and WYL domains [Chloroflexi bacterium AL-N5]NOK80675.1 putative DNA-binding transcriptional regulator YafY, contains an HTH and WYL domains [Chloroflexi bacterium AL-W]NOK8867